MSSEPKKSTAEEKSQDSLRNSSYKAVSSYFAERPILSEPYDEAYRRNSLWVPRNHHVLIYVVVMGLLAIVSWNLEIQELGTIFTPTGLIYLFWISLAFAGVCIYLRDES